MVTISPAKKTYLVFFIIWGGVIGIGIVAAFKINSWQFPVIWIGLLGLLISYMIISRFKVSWNDSKLFYRGLFKTRTIKFSDIKKFEVKSSSSRWQPTIGLYIYSERHIDIINIKLFSSEDLNNLIKVLKQKVII